MLAAERHSWILREIFLRGRLDTREFAERLGLSGMTIRRDLAELAARGELHRVHGGAVAAATHRGEHQRTGEPPGPLGRPLGTLGLIVPDSSYYFPEVIRGASTAARAAGVRLVLGVSGYDPDEECRQLLRMVANGVDGVLLVTAVPDTRDGRTWRTIGGLDVPVVLVERSSRGAPVGLQLDTVRSDHAFGAELAVDHLVAQGHRRVALIARAGPTTPWVLKGYRRSLRRHGVDDDAPVTVDAWPGGQGSPQHELRGFLDRCAQQQTRAVLVLPDALAISLLGVAEERGLRVPEDLAVIAYDDEIATLGSVPLTAVAPPKDTVGRQAVQVCLAHLQSVRPLPTHQITLSPTLHIRESSMGPGDLSAAR